MRRVSSRVVPDIEHGESAPTLPVSTHRDGDLREHDTIVADAIFGPLGNTAALLPASAANLSEEQQLELAIAASMEDLPVLPVPASAAAATGPSADPVPGAESAPTTAEEGAPDSADPAFGTTDVGGSDDDEGEEITLREAIARGPPDGTGGGGSRGGRAAAGNGEILRRFALQDQERRIFAFEMKAKKLLLVDEFVSFSEHIVLAMLLRGQLLGRHFGWWLVVAPVWVGAAASLTSRTYHAVCNERVMRETGTGPRSRLAARLTHVLALFHVGVRCAFAALIATKLSAPDSMSYWTMFLPVWVAPPIAAVASLRVQVLSQPLGESGPNCAALSCAALLAAVLGTLVPLMLCRKLSDTHVGYSWATLMTPVWVVVGAVLLGCGCALLAWLATHVSRAAEARLGRRDAYNGWTVVVSVVLAIAVPFTLSAAFLARRLDGDESVTVEQIIDPYILANAFFLFFAWPVHAVYTLQHLHQEQRARSSALAHEHEMSLRRTDFRRLQVSTCV